MVRQEPGGGGAERGKVLYEYGGVGGKGGGGGGRGRRAGEEEEKGTRATREMEIKGGKK